MPTIVHILVTLVFSSLLRQASCSWSSEDYVHDACNVTRYPDICIRSLSPFSDTAKQDPSKWARAGVSVTIGEAKSVTRFLIELRRRNNSVARGAGRRISRAPALYDCIELVFDALDNLHRSLDVLRNLSAEMFDSQMGDVTTWISAALTDEDTCLDGLDDGGPKQRQIRMLHNRVANVSHFTSNALALVAKLATAGPENLYGP